MQTPQAPALSGMTPLGITPVPPVSIFDLDALWESHVDEHSFADGTADPTTCPFCAESAADGSWTDDLVG